MLGAQPRQGVGMCHYTSRAAALAVLVGALACSDRPPGTAPDAPPDGPGILSTAAPPPAGGVRRAGHPAAARPRAAARAPGDRGGPGRDRLCDRAGRHRVPVVRGLLSVAAAPSAAAGGAGPVPDQSPFRG